MIFTRGGWATPCTRWRTPRRRCSCSYRGYYYRGAGELTTARARGKFFRFLKMALKWLAIYFAYTVFLYAAARARDARRAGAGRLAALDLRAAIAVFADRAAGAAGRGRSPVVISPRKAVAALMMMFFERLRLRRWRLPVAVGLLAALLLIELVVNLRRVANPPRGHRNGLSHRLSHDAPRRLDARPPRAPLPPPRLGLGAQSPAAALLFSVWEFFAPARSSSSTAQAR